jgi:hypothetical protein
MLLDVSLADTPSAIATGIVHSPMSAQILNFVQELLRAT